MSNPPNIALTWDPVAGAYAMTQTPSVITPPVTVPPVIVPPATAGVTASRSADLLRLLGMNTASSVNATSNVWGAWPFDGSPASVDAGNSFFPGGLRREREFSYAGYRTWQEPWCKARHAATGVRFSLTPGSNAGIVDAQAIADMAVLSSTTDGWIEQIEGALEPNNFKIPADQCVAMQKILWAAGQATKGNKYPVKVAGPSVVVGMPYPEGWIMPFNGKPGYFTAAQLADIKANMEVINLHFYPPSNADLASGGRGGWLQDTLAGVKVAYGDLPVCMTEYAPTLYNSGGHAGDAAYDAYYAGLLLISAFREGIDAVHWFAMADWGQTTYTDTTVTPPVQRTRPNYATGLFPVTGGVSPRPSAATLAAMFALMADGATDRYTFTPGSLGITVTGLPPPAAGAPNSGGQWMLLQSRQTGVYFAVLLNSQVSPDGVASPVVVTFDKPVTKVVEYNVTDPTAGGPMKSVQSVAGASVVKVALTASLRVLVITP